MSEKLTDERLEEIRDSWMCQDESHTEISLALTELIALRAERAKATQSDEERADDLEKYSRYSTKADSGEMKAVYLRAFASIRAEGSAERAKLEAALCEVHTMLETAPYVPIEQAYAMRDRIEIIVIIPPGSGFKSIDIDSITGTADDQGLFAQPAESGATCATCQGSGYGGHPDSGALCFHCNGTGETLGEALDRLAGANP